MFCFQPFHVFQKLLGPVPDPPIVAGTEPKAEVQTQGTSGTHPFFVANTGVKSSGPIGADAKGQVKKMHFFVDDRN